VTYPISVVIPHLVSRREFFSTQCLPSVLENNPAEIIIIPNRGRPTVCPGHWRNIGVEKASQPYVMFVDDDSVIRPGAFKLLLDALKGQPEEVGFSYPNVRMVVVDGVQSKYKDGAIMKGRPWDQDALFKGNYITNMSLIRTAARPRYDPKLKRLNDWDLWLDLAERGFRGVHVDSILVELHQIDRSVSECISDDEAVRTVLRKRGL